MQISNLAASVGRDHCPRRVPLKVKLLPRTNFTGLTLLDCMLVVQNDIQLEADHS